ncbi:MAG: NAD-dependent protein deacylase, partial [Erysipelotrichales bacterium]|nr:NAD-dependent protein deacylase [Erysipelotrichales bacterium]
TEEFYRFYKDRMIYEDAKPNRTHKVLAEMEKKGLCDAVITQNIDGLHQAAGSKNVIELHGSVLRNTCMRCGKKYDLDYVMGHEGVPRCEKCGGIVKPDVVLYEEGLNEEDIENAIRAIEEAEVLIIGGTSLVVYPAAGMIRYYRGNKLVLINRSSTPYDNYANLVFHDSLGDVFEEIGKEL